MSKSNSLIEFNTQCHEHLRESDRKKDAMLGLYLTATFVILGFFGNNFYKSNSPSLMWGCMSALVLAGTCLGVLMSFYRAWHGLYIISLISIQEMIIKAKDEVGYDFIRDIKFKFNSILSVEFFTFLFLHVFIALNLIFMFVSKAQITDNTIFSGKLCNIVSFALLGLAFAEFVAHFIVMMHFDKLKKQGILSEKYLWVLYGRLNSSKI